MKKILVAGMGNVLQRDDGFGVEIARQLASHKSLPDGVRVIEVGIGGIHLVQELMEGYDALVLIDAVERDSAPGTVHLLEADVPELATWSEAERRDFLADMHYATPSKALILAKALGVLPRKVFILGCQPEVYEELGIGLSETVTPSVAVATQQVLQVVEQLRSN